MKKIFHAVSGCWGGFFNKQEREKSSLIPVVLIMTSIIIGVVPNLVSGTIPGRHSVRNEAVLEDFG